MPRTELPIIVRLSQQELARALGRPTNDSSVQRLGGLTVVLLPRSDAAAGTPLPDLIGTLAGPPSLQALAGSFRPVEPALLRRLKTNPALAKRYVLDPVATLRELDGGEHGGDGQSGDGQSGDAAGRVEQSASGVRKLTDEQQ
jgi:hypothetical protein